jgi:hypothetical protein
MPCATAQHEGIALMTSQTTSFAISVKLSGTVNVLFKVHLFLWATLQHILRESNGSADESGSWQYDKTPFWRMK